MIGKKSSKYQNRSNVHFKVHEKHLQKLATNDWLFSYFFFEMEKNIYYCNFETILSSLSSMHFEIVGSNTFMIYCRGFQIDVQSLRAE